MKKSLAKYQNGNCFVEIFSDGTKVREYVGKPTPEFPESIDLKITDWCDAGCPECHENSTKKGKHAEVKDILRIIKGLPAGIELAIGGGDPFSHPDIEIILNEIAERNLIANVTVNMTHVIRNLLRISEYRLKHLVKGLGVSFNERTHAFGHELELIKSVFDNNTVLHVIAGVHSWNNVRMMSIPNLKVLILGYKQYGRGLKMYTPHVDNNINEWRYWLPSILQSTNVTHVSFDNSAIEQLGVERFLTEEQFSSFYMGDEGRFSMYVDAVRNEYAISSVNQRLSLQEDGTITTAFSKIQESFS